MAYYSDFKVFGAKVSGQPVKACFSAFDREFADAAKATGAKFSRNLTGGRAGWSIPADSATAEAFVAAAGAAFARAEAARIAAWNAKSSAEKAKFFDGQNEGGEGYNPYRAGGR